MSQKTIVDKIGETAVYITTGAVVGFAAGAVLSYTAPGQTIETIVNVLGADVKLEAIESKRNADFMAAGEVGGVAGLALYGIRELAKKAYEFVR